MIPIVNSIAQVVKTCVNY